MPIPFACDFAALVRREQLVGVRGADPDAAIEDGDTRLRVVDANDDVDV
jgi:hypothetical protein